MSAATIQLEIPKSVMQSARLSIEELKVELAIHLYARRRLSFGKSCELASVSALTFRQLLGAREVRAAYDPEDVDRDVENLRDLGLL
jgi:predicted HTH domain antitoxin